MGELIGDIIGEVKEDLQHFINKAKAAWDRGEQELHDLFHKKAQEVAPAGTSVERSGNEDGVLVAVTADDAAPAKDEADKAAAEAKPE